MNLKFDSGTGGVTYTADNDGNVTLLTHGLRSTKPYHVEVLV